jgi:hypothetical protein
MKLQNGGLNQSISGSSKDTGIICVFLIFKQNVSSQFFDLDIENPLGGGTPAEIESPLYKLD